MNKMLEVNQTEPKSDLAGVLSQAQQEEQAAAALERQAADQRAKAQRAAELAQAQQEQARRRWAEGVMAAHDDRRRTAHAALTVAETAWQDSPAEPATILPTWMARERARADLFGVEVEREKAAGILGRGSRPAKVPRPDLAGDLSALLGRWSLELLSAQEEAVNEALSAATTGRATDA